jgi:N-methylhydantoinase B/acetone carboxylase alpha subunit
MSTDRPTDDRVEYDHVEPPIGWDGQTLQEMLDEGDKLSGEGGTYRGLDSLELKQETPFEYERLNARIRGALVNARETAMHISASPIVRQVGELCFQVYTPEGDCFSLSTGIITHVHTGSLAIKYMIEEDYEHTRGIQPGDIFCNNDNDLGNVHTTDIHTFLPVFHDGELVAWVDGVTHEIDIGGLTWGHDQLASTSRYEDGLYATCEKIGEDDELFKDWKRRAERATRTPMYWELDEKCRLAGCQIIRDTIRDVIDDVGVDTFKQFSREVVEEGRRDLKTRMKQRTFPGKYRSVSFMPLPLEDEAWKPETRIDRLNHIPIETEIEEDGGLTVDATGSSSAGLHAYNAAEGALTGGMWVYLTQKILHEAKVNDGSHLAIDTQFPLGSIVNPQDPDLSYHTSWATLMPTFNSMAQGLNRSIYCRGFVEEAAAGFNSHGDVMQGGGELNMTGDEFPIASMDATTMGQSGSPVRDGEHVQFSLFNPETDINDIEEAELMEGAVPYLSRKIKTDTAGHGKYRGGAGLEVVRTVVGADVSIYKQMHPGNTFFSTGLAGGYPAAAGYNLRAHDTNLMDLIHQDEAYPIDDSPPGSLEEKIEGDIVRQDRCAYFPTEFDQFDLFYMQSTGGHGWGDPLERPIDKLKEDVELEVYSPDVVESVYGIVGEYDEDDNEFFVDHGATEERRQEIGDEREAETVPAEEFWEEERERVRSADMADVVLEMYADVFAQPESAEWAEEFREFWDLQDSYTPPADPPDNKGGVET